MLGFIFQKILLLTNLSDLFYNKLTSCNNSQITNKKYSLNWKPTLGKFQAQPLKW